MRFLHWLVDHLAVVCLALILFVGGLYIHDQAAYSRDQEARATRNRASICAAFESYTIALVGAGAPSATPEKRAEKQATVDAFQKDIETRLAPLGCHFASIVAR